MRRFILLTGCYGKEDANRWVRFGQVAMDVRAVKRGGLPSRWRSWLGLKWRGRPRARGVWLCRSSIRLAGRAWAWSGAQGRSTQACRRHIAVSTAITHALSIQELVGPHQNAALANRVKPVRIGELLLFR